MTLTLDRVILHTVMHHSSTSTYMPNYTEIEETFCGWTDVRKYVRMDRRTFETGFIRSTLSKSRPKKFSNWWNNDKRCNVHQSESFTIQTNDLVIHFSQIISNQFVLHKNWTFHSQQQHC